MKRLASITALSVLLFSIFTQGSSASTPAVSSWTLQKFDSQTLNWTPCNDGFECSSFKVPVDYNNLNGQTFTLQVIKHDANDPDKRIGSIVMNPGGPGGSGIQYVLSADSIVSTSIENVYDLIGFDPRGVNLSDPIRCLSDSQEDYFLGGNGSVQNSTDLANAIASAKLMADSCAKVAGNKLGHYSTLDTAKDMEILRNLLKEPKLNYIGKSYGTFLGTLYAALFPKTTGRIVLDGAVDPNISVRDQNLAQAVGFDTALKSYLASNNRFSLTQIENLLQQARTKPITNQQHRQLSESLMVTGIAAALYDPADGWPLLTKALAGAILDRNPYDFFLLSDSYNQRDQNGHYLSNQNDISEVISCLDFKDPRTLPQIESDAKNFEKAAPFFGKYLSYSGLPCLYWHAPAVTEPSFKNLVTNPLLVVGTTRDPATPYQWAQALHKDLLNSTLITLRGDGHTGANRGSSCVDAAVNTYLLTGKSPAHDITCDMDSALASSVTA